ncbi:MAG TPA: DUF3501 family protein [Kofleriaceae bacterium]|nr:DUF3501 family protein [Kofleriaceae bacterium]
MSSLLRPITRADIKGPAIYAGMRDAYLKRMIEIKKARRIDVGPLVFLVFENRHTLTMQIEEMCRVEHLTRDDQIEAELEVYNALMPNERSLSATLFISLPPDADAVAELGRLVGLDEHVILHIGPHALRAEFEAGRSTGDKISAVQYVRFPLPDEARRLLANAGTPISVEIDHPEYRHRTEGSDALRTSLAKDYE